MQNVLEIVNLICTSTSLLYIWFETEAFVTYCESFNMFKSLIRSYYNTVNLSFPQFLFNNYKNTNNSVFRFVIKLITCPVCLNLWLSFIICTVTGYMSYTFTIYTLSLLLYFTIKRIVL